MIIYNGGNSRIKSQYVENNSTVFTKYYCGPYEEIQKGSTTRKNYYIYAGGEIAAVYTEGASDAGMYYFHNDHLGSPWLITNASGSEVQRLNFNAWGRRRDASNWNNYTNLPEMKFDRGFTGHEHLDMFGLINMNARLYDPVLGRFLSPDPIVQVPDFTQSYNGYSYALNNPLSYRILMVKVLSLLQLLLVDGLAWEVLWYPVIRVVGDWLEICLKACLLEPLLVLREHGLVELLQVR